MPRSFEEWLRELASAAGVSQEQFLKVAGIIHLLPFIPKESEELRVKSLVWSLLKAKRVASLNELQRELLADEEGLEAALRELEAEGKACEVDTYAYGRLVAVSDDGTLDISKLNAEDRASVVSATYANRSQNLTYKSVLELCRRTIPPPSAEERILELLEAGAKRYVDLLKAGIPKARIYPALKSLMEKGKVKKLKRGVYSLA